MKQTKLYNNLPAELLAKTKLKPGQTVTYRLANMRPIPMDPSRLAIPTIFEVPAIDQIYNKETGEYYDIAAVRSFDAQGNHTFHPLYFTRQSAGHLTLVGGRAQDQEIHSYLSLCNYNGSNPDRDTSKEIMFELVDEEAKAELQAKTRNLKREALNAAADLSPEEVRDYIAALGKDDTRTVKVLRNEIEDLADSDPQAFMDLISNKQAVMKATVNRAIKKGVIIFNEEQSRFEWPNKEAIFTAARGSEAVNELISFCVSSAKGEAVYKTIQSKAKK